MKHSILAIALIAPPAVVGAQASAKAQIDSLIPDSYSEYARERIMEAFHAARVKHVPDDQMRKRLAEGQVRGATDVQVSSVVQRTEKWLEASRALLIRAGRDNPQPEEITNAEQAMERGATQGQIEAAVKTSAENMSLAATLDALLRPGEATVVGAASVRKP